METVIRFALALALLVSSVLFAGAFDDVQIGGPCAKKNMDIIENGDVISILLHDFGANMPQGEEGDGRFVRRVCDFRMRITFPKEEYLAGLKQVFSGGLIKSEKASGQLHIFSRILHDIAMVQPLQWKAGKAITPEQPESVFTITLDEKLPKPVICSGRMNYATRLTLQAQRPNTNKEFFIGAVDSIDTELTQRVDLIPDWQRCDGKRREPRGRDDDRRDRDRDREGHGPTRPARR